MFSGCDGDLGDMGVADETEGKAGGGVGGRGLGVGVVGGGVGVGVFGGGVGGGCLGGVGGWWGLWGLRQGTQTKRPLIPEKKTGYYLRSLN